MKVEDLGFGIPILCRLSILAPCVSCILRQFDQFPGISSFGDFSVIYFFLDIWYQHAFAK